MLKYAKIIDENTGLCQIGDGDNIEFYEEIGMTELDVCQSDINNGWYLSDGCPMKTDKEKENELKNKKLNQLNEELKNLDIKRIRAICEPEIKDEETGETWLEYYNGQIQNLRIQIQILEERIDENGIIEQNLPALDSGSEQTL